MPSLGVSQFDKGPLQASFNELDAEHEGRNIGVAKIKNNIVKVFNWTSTWNCRFFLKSSISYSEVELVPKA
jgi:hypothetical protein